jgi:hypothetical protein
MFGVSEAGQNDACFGGTASHIFAQNRLEQVICPLEVQDTKRTVERDKDKA